MKLDILLDNDGWENVQSSKDVEQEMDWVEKKLRALRHSQNIVSWEMKKYFPMFIMSYDDRYDKLERKTKYKAEYFNGQHLDVHARTSRFLIPDNTPNIEKLWPTIQKLANQTVFNHDNFMKYFTIKKKLTKQFRSQSMAKVNPSGIKQSTPEEITQIANDKPKLHVGPRKMDNPLVACTTGLYVGPPEQYPDLTGTQQDIFIKIQNTFKKLGLPPLTVLYGGRYVTRHGSHINFVVTNADSTFAWRKYDTGGGAGQNYIYLKDGTKLNTQAFLHNITSLLNTHQK